MQDPTAIDRVEAQMEKITRRRTSSFWSARDVAFLKKYAALGYEWRDIGDNLPDKKRSVPATRQKAASLGLSQ